MCSVLNPNSFIFHQDVVLDLINQIRDLRNELVQKEETVGHLSGDFKDITVLCSVFHHTFDLALITCLCI